MHTKTLLTVAIALVGAAFSATAGTVSYGEVTPDYPMAFTSTLTRAEVRTDALRARAAGHIAIGERSYVVAETGPGLTRAQVVAETLEAIRVGAIDHHEHTQVLTAMQLDSIRQAGLRAVAMTVASR